MERTQSVVIDTPVDLGPSLRTSPNPVINKDATIYNVPRLSRPRYVTESPDLQSDKWRIVGIGERKHSGKVFSSFHSVRSLEVFTINQKALGPKGPERAVRQDSKSGPNHLHRIDDKRCRGVIFQPRAEGPQSAGGAGEDAFCSRLSSGTRMRVQGRRYVTDNDVPPKWRHMLSVGQSVAGRTPRWSGLALDARTTRLVDGILYYLQILPSDTKSAVVINLRIGSKLHNLLYSRSERFLPNHRSLHTTVTTFLNSQPFLCSN